MKMKLTAVRNAIAGAALALPVAATAAVPTYVSTALTNAQTVLTEYLEAAAPFLFAVTIIVASIFLVQRFIKRAAG